MKSGNCLLKTQQRSNVTGAFASVFQVHVSLNDTNLSSARYSSLGTTVHIQTWQPLAAAIDDGPPSQFWPQFSNPPVTALTRACHLIEWSSLIIACETGGSPRSRLEQVTQPSSGSSLLVVHTPVVSAKTGSASPPILTVARAPLATSLMEL